MTLSQTPQKFTIRNALHSDAAGIAALEQVCGLHAWSEQQYAAQIQREGALTFIALDSSNTLSGFVSCQEAADEIEVYKIAVILKSRKHGLGEQLMRYMLAQAALHGCNSAHLEVAHSNEAAIGLYKKLGFTETYRRKNYYAITGDDALVMRLEIVAISTIVP